MKEQRVHILIYVIINLSGGILYLVSSYLRYEEAFKDIGNNLFVAGLIGFLLEFISREKENAPIKFLGPGRDLGAQYQHSFSLAKRKIDIIALSFTAGFEQLHEYFAHKIIKDNCKIRILILDPESPAYNERCRDEHGGTSNKLPEYSRLMIRETAKVVEGFRAFYEKFTVAHDKHFRTPGSIRVKMYRGIPYFGYFRVDDHCMITPYFAFGYGIESPVFEIGDPDLLLFEFYAKHFEILWERADSTSIIDIREFSSLA